MTNCRNVSHQTTPLSVRKSADKLFPSPLAGVYFLSTFACDTKALPYSCITQATVGPDSRKRKSQLRFARDQSVTNRARRPPTRRRCGFGGRTRGTAGFNRSVARRTRPQQPCMRSGTELNPFGARAFSPSRASDGAQLREHASHRLKHVGFGASGRLQDRGDVLEFGVYSRQLLKHTEPSLIDVVQHPPRLGHALLDLLVGEADAPFGLGLGFAEPFVALLLRGSQLIIDLELGVGAEPDQFSIELLFRLLAAPGIGNAHLVDLSNSLCPKLFGFFSPTTEHLGMLEIECTLPRLHLGQHVSLSRASRFGVILGRGDQRRRLGTRLGLHLKYLVDSEPKHFRQPVGDRRRRRRGVAQDRVFVPQGGNLHPESLGLVVLRLPLNHQFREVLVDGSRIVSIARAFEFRSGIVNEGCHLVPLGHASRWADGGWPRPAFRSLTDVRIPRDGRTTMPTQPPVQGQT